MLELGKAGRIELIDSVLSLHARLDQVCLLEHFQVLGYCRCADFEPVCDLTGREFAAGKHLDDPLAGWVGKGRGTQHRPIMKYLLN